MSIFFLHPIYLFGLLAASLPILIHLLNRRKLNRVRFPAVRFIMLSQRRISRSYRLRHWLLLALRTLAVVFLALLLANPVFQTGAGLFAGGGQVSLVVLLDNSLSMSWSGDGNGFRHAKEAARLLISSLQAGDRGVVMPTHLTGNESLRLKGEKEVLLKEGRRSVPRARRAAGGAARQATSGPSSHSRTTRSSSGSSARSHSTRARFHRCDCQA